MNSEQNWKALDDQKDNDLLSLLQPGRIQQIRSTDPLLKIKNSLRFSIMWTVIISALYIVTLYFYPHWQVVITIGVVLLFTAFGGISAFRQYKKIQRTITGSQPLLNELEKHYNSIHSWMSLQLKAAVFIYPFASVGGFIIGLQFGSGKTIEQMLNKPGMFIWLIGTTIVLVPCGLYLAKRLLNKSYGKHLVVLKKNIDELKAAI